MTYEETPRNSKREQAIIAKLKDPREKYRQSRSYHLREMARLIREIHRQYLLIRQAKLVYRLEK